ncbi:MAG: chemotaxis response regulator protein-glutamate methylesterase [Deltaproteobacteria bacterium]|nr:chemotaxis response regulator protein-glutamate methylesterase [Deltaproteobacteria bacterium]
MTKPVRVLIIDDSAFNRRTLTKLLESIPGIEVAGTAADGSEGLKQAAKLKPDLITLDLEMPIMDGFTFLRILMQTNPIPVIVISSRNEDVNVFKAMELGAVDFIPKPTHTPSMALLNIKDELFRKVNMLPHLKMEKLARSVSKPLEDTRAEIKKVRQAHHDKCHPELVEGLSLSKDGFDVIAIGSSTGGPPALSAILPCFPEGFPVNVIVSQHMPTGFTKAFAERLNKMCKMRVREAANDEAVKTGEILIAPGGNHLSFKRNRTGEVVTNLLERREADKYVPSVDIMFSSAASIWGGRTMGVVLTGMGYDGKDGVKRIKEKGGYVIAESEETSIVFGMPESAIATGVVDEVVPLYDIGEKIVKGCVTGLLKRA